MHEPHWPTGLPWNFGGLEGEHAGLEGSRVAILPVPYDFSTSYQAGTREGPAAIIAASRNMEIWDDELGATWRAGIHTLPELEPTAEGPGAMVRRVEQAFDWMLEQPRLPVMLEVNTASARAPCARWPGGIRGSPCCSSTPMPTCATATSRRPTAMPA